MKENSNQNLNNNISNFIMNSLEQEKVSNRKTKKYQKIINECRENFYEIKEYLPKEKNDLIFNYEENMNHLQKLEDENAYKKGFKDCFYIFSQLIFN